MGDESSPITIKIEIEEELPEDQVGISKEHNYNKIIEDDLHFRLQVHHSIDIKEEREEVESENSCSDEMSNQQKIEAEKPSVNLEELQNDKLIKEDLDIELDELQHTADIKVEEDLMEVDNMQKEYNLISENSSSVKLFGQNYQATNDYLRINTQGEGTTAEYLRLEDFGEVKMQKMPISSGGKFLKQFIEIGKQQNIVSQILKYYAQDEPTNKH